MNIPKHRAHIFNSKSRRETNQSSVGVSTKVYPNPQSRTIQKRPFYFSGVKPQNISLIDSLNNLSSLLRGGVVLGSNFGSNQLERTVRKVHIASKKYGIPVTIEFQNSEVPPITLGDDPFEKFRGFKDVVGIIMEFAGSKVAYNLAMTSTSAWTALIDDPSRKNLKNVMFTVKELPPLYRYKRIRDALREEEEEKFKGGLEYITEIVMPVYKIHDEKKRRRKMTDKQIIAIAKSRFLHFVNRVTFPNGTKSSLISKFFNYARYLKEIVIVKPTLETYVYLGTHSGEKLINKIKPPFLERTMWEDYSKGEWISRKKPIIPLEKLKIVARFIHGFDFNIINKFERLNYLVINYPDDPVGEEYSKTLNLKLSVLSDHPSLIHLLIFNDLKKKHFNKKSGEKLIDELSKLENIITLDIRGFTKLTNLIKLTPLKKLTIMTLIDNGIQKIEGVDNLVNLKELDLRNNSISSIEGVDNLVNLKELYLKNNSISSIEGVDKLVNLEILELKNNSISSIEGVDKLVNMTKLYLGNNSISSIKGVEELVNLEILRLKKNSISSIEGVDKLVNLEILDLRNNSISSIGGVDNLVNLKGLYLGNNSISSIEGLDKLINLRKLFLNDQKTKLFKKLDLAKLPPNLEVLNIRKNPNLKHLENTGALKKLKKIIIN